jgi:tRNA U38,U39,U40 pseudouridine synthase TruA
MADIQVDDNLKIEWSEVEANAFTVKQIDDNFVVDWKGNKYNAKQVEEYWKGLYDKLAYDHAVMEDKLMQLMGYHQFLKFMGQDKN